MNIGLAYCVTVTGAKHHCFLGQRFPNSVLGERLVFCPSTTQLIQITNSSSSFDYLNQLCRARAKTKTCTQGGPRTEFGKLVLGCIWVGKLVRCLQSFHWKHVGCNIFLFYCPAAIEMSWNTLKPILINLIVPCIITDLHQQKISYAWMYTKTHYQRKSMLAITQKRSAIIQKQKSAYWPSQQNKNMTHLFRGACVANSLRSLSQNK